MILVLLLALLTLPATSWATSYYMSPAGSNSNDGLTTGTPWLTFAHAFTNTACGDSLLLMDGTYGDGTSTGKIDLVGRTCTQGAEFTIVSLNERKAQVFDNGTGYAVRIRNSAYVRIYGLYGRSADNNYVTDAATELGFPFATSGSNHIEFRNNVGANPNRYGNTHVFHTINSLDILFEGNEGYIFGRHCIMGFTSERVTVRQQYCNPRGGKIAGGFSEGGSSLGSGDALFTFYPCKDCILENSIADGTESPMYMSGFNANYGGSILMSGAKILGSICYKCNISNGVYSYSRTAAGINYSPQNFTIRDVVFADWGSASQAIRCSDCVNGTIDHVTVLGTGTTGNGIFTEDTATGTTPAENSITITNTLIKGVTSTGFSISGYNTWSGDRLISNSNGTAYSPALPSNWTNAATTDPGMGTCKLWVPDGAAAKGAGSSGSDIGATILYQYRDGVLTTTPLWDPVTGAFPHGAATDDGINRVAGASVHDIHTRLNVNAGGCSFPAGYGGGGGTTTVVKGTTAASSLVTTATPLSWNHTITASQDQLLVCVGLRDNAGNVGSVSGIDVSGSAMTLVKRQVTAPAYRAVELWKLASPTSGVRTITATLTGAISGALGRSMEFDLTSGLGTEVGGSTPGLAGSLSVTVATNVSELVVDCTVSSSGATFTHGPDQTGYDSLSHSTVSLRLEASTQNGPLGGVMSNSTGSNVYQAKIAVSLIAGTPDPVSGAILTGTQYQVFNGFGTELSVGQAVAKNTQATLRPEGFARIRGEIEASVDVSAPFTPALYCSLNGGGYTPVLDTFGSNVFRYYGPGPESSENPIPPTGSGVLQKLNTGQFRGGVVLRDTTTAYVVSSLSPGERVEMEAAVQFTATANDVIACRWYNSNGTALVYGANGTASILITQPGAIAGY